MTNPITHARTILTPNEYQAWILHHRGLSQHNIALALNLGRWTVRDRLERAQRKLDATPAIVNGVDVTDHVVTTENPWPHTGAAKPTSSPTTKQQSSPKSSSNSPTTTQPQSKKPAPTKPQPAATTNNSEESPPSAEE